MRDFTVRRPIRDGRLTAVVATAALLIAACTGPGESADPTSSEPSSVEPSRADAAATWLVVGSGVLDGAPERELAGTVVVDGCVGVELPEGPALAVWPPGTELRDSGESVQGGSGGKVRIGEALPEATGQLVSSDQDQGGAADQEGYAECIESFDQVVHIIDVEAWPRPE